MVTRLDKLARLIAVFDQFHDSLATLNDPVAKLLVENWSAYRYQYVKPNGVPRSALANGMEQGLREKPVLLASMQPEVRKVAAEALAAAIASHYAEFLTKDAARLEKIHARGYIRGENEYHLVRHQVDVLEGQPGREKELHRLYQLLQQFELRGK